MRIMSPITARSRHAKPPRTHVHSHRTDVVKAGNYYAGRHTAQGTLVTVTRSGRTKPLGAGYDLWNNPPTGFSWGLQRQRLGSVGSCDFDRLLRSEARRKGARGSFR